MANFRPVFTVDYEISGDGNGDVRDDLVEPTRRLCRVMEEYGIRLTLFVDVCEYWAFEEAEKKGILPGGESPATLMRDQLQDLVRRGHDVQLHVHPQWLDAKYDPARGWSVNPAYWRVPLVPHGFGEANDRRSILGLLTQGKRTLEQMIRPAKEDYECLAFRAGACCIQPSADVLRAMAVCGLKIDSSVLPGARCDDGLAWYDYRRALGLGSCWRIMNCVTEPVSDGAVVEAPILTVQIGPVRKLMDVVSAARSCRTRSRNSAGIKQIRGSQWRSLWTFLFSHYVVADFTMRSYETMRTALSRHMSGANPTLESETPLVLIGHPKSFGDDRALRALLTWIKHQDGVESDALGSPSPWNALAETEPAGNLRKENGRSANDVFNQVSEL